MPSISEIEDIILDTARSFAKVRLNKKYFCFTDPSLAKSFKKGCYVSTCEGLEVIFLTLLELNTDLSQISSQHKKLQNAILKDVEYLLKKAESSGFTEFPGDPYLCDQGKHLRPSQGKCYPNFESAAFFISVVVHVMELSRRGVVQIQDELLKQLENALKKSCEFLVKHHRKNEGWSWGAEGRRSEIYFTWTILETVYELESYKSRLKQDFDNSGTLSETLAWVEEIAFSPENGILSQWRDFYHDPPKYREDALRPFYEYSKTFYKALYVLTSLSILGTDKVAKLASYLGNMLNTYDRVLANDLVTQHTFAEEDLPNLEDASIVPVFLRTITHLMYTYSRNTDAADSFFNGVGAIYTQVPKILEKFYQHITIKNLVKKDSNRLFSGFFGMRENGNSPLPEVYYSERVVEALLSYRQYLLMTGQEVKPAPFVPIREPIRKRRTQIKTVTPPTPAQIPELLASIANLNSQLLSNYQVVFVQHLFRDFLGFTFALEQIGLRPDVCDVIGVPYSSKPETASELRKNGYNVEIPASFPFDEQLETLLSNRLDRARDRNEKVLIVEDGGYCVPLLHRSFQERLNLVKGAVEQTANGIWRDEEVAGILRIPVVDVARSRIKRDLEAPFIGDAVVRNCERILEKEDQVLRGRDTLVVGFGSIGEQVARALKSREVIVSVYDSDPISLEKARTAGYKTSTELKDLIISAKVVIGCSGKTSISNEMLIYLPDDVWLANGSSKRIEIDVDALEKMATSKELLPEVGTRYELIDGRKITLMAQGYPINFYGDAESVPDRAIEFLHVLLLKGLVFVADTPLKPEIVSVPDFIQKEVATMRRKVVNK